MNNPLISICIATYNRVELLKNLLESIKIQTFKNYEILINDNSTNNDVALLVKSYKDILDINYEKNNPTVSAGSNCNIVMKRANGTWIKLMHDDDWFETSTALEKFAQVALTTNKNFIFSGSYQVRLNSTQSTLKLFTSNEKKMLDETPFCLFVNNIIGQPSLTMHKKVDGLYYDESFNFLLDIDFYMRYFNVYPGYEYINEPLINIGISPQQETYKYYKNINVELPEYFTLLAKFNNHLLINNQYAFHLIWNMLKRYKIKKTEEIYNVGYKGPMPIEINDIIAFQKYIPNLILKQTPWSKKLMTICFKKIMKNSTKSFD